MAELATIVDENVNGTRVVKSFAAEERQVNQLGRAADHLRWANVEAIRQREVPGRKLYTATSMPMEPIAAGEERWGVAMWTDVDPEMAAILQMQKIQEAYEDSGNKALAQDVFRRVLAESDNQTIRNAAYLMLGDSLKETGRTEEAVEVYQRALAENVKAADP